MTKLMQFVALIAVLGCVLPTTVTAQSWNPAVFCPRGQKVVGFLLYFENRQNRRLVAIVLICTRGSRIISPPGPPPGTGIPGAVRTCRSGRFLRSCRLQLERPGRNTRANNLNCRCDDGQTLQGDGSQVGIWQAWSTSCRTGIVGIQTFAGKTPNPFHTFNVRFLCSHPSAVAEIEEVEEEVVEEVEEEVVEEVEEEEE